jgi:hypothetical protein
MSTVSALKVFALFGHKSLDSPAKLSATTDTMVNNDSAPSSASAAAPVPPGGWENFWKMLTPGEIHEPFGEQQGILCTIHRGVQAQSCSGNHREKGYRSCTAATT